MWGLAQVVPFWNPNVSFLTHTKLLSTGSTGSVMIDAFQRAYYQSVGSGEETELMLPSSLPE